MNMLALCQFQFYPFWIQGGCAAVAAGWPLVIRAYPCATFQIAQSCRAQHEVEAEGLAAEEAASLP